MGTVARLGSFQSREGHRGDDPHIATDTTVPTSTKLARMGCAGLGKIWWIRMASSSPFIELLRVHSRALAARSQKTINEREPMN
jgi:hypothetical protein